MRFGLLGSLEVLDDDGAPVDVGGHQPRTVLAVLVAAEGRVVSADALVHAVWGDDPPASANGTLQSYVSRLRRRFGSSGDLLVYEAPGYRLDVPPDAVDFRRFEALVAEGRSLLGQGRLVEGRDRLADALALWRGPALADLRDHEPVTALVARLEESHLSAAVARVEADLELGHHAAVLGELTGLVAAHPLQEDLRADLALALYRCGRQADALRAIEDARRTLVEQLGVDPGRRLRDLEAAILAHDPALDAPAAPTPPASSPPDPAGTADRPAEATSPGAPLLGRASELRELLEALDEARAGTVAVVVEGEPGIGKTRLVEELAAEAGRRGDTVLWGRGFEGGVAPALWPWLAPLRALAERQAAGAAPPPELDRLLATNGGPEDVPSGPEPARYQLFESVHALLAASAATSPVVLVLEDLQWADLASLELVASLAGQVRDVPLLFVATVRELEVGRNDAVVDTLAALTRRPGTRRLHLRGLTGSAIAELVMRTTGAVPSDDALEAIRQRAEGNPFFATELARLLATGHDLADVPSGVRDVVRRRLAQLPPDTAALLEIAAVVGRDTDVGLLVRASGREPDACLDALEPALVQRLLVPVHDQPGSYRFAHALVREVLVDGISPLRRARLHLRVADALPENDDTAEILAEHLWAAVPIGVGVRAAGALERASQVATRRLSLPAAEHLLERAVQLRRSAGSSSAEQAAELEALIRLISVAAARRGRAAMLGSPLLARGKVLAEQVGHASVLLSITWDEWAGLDLANRYTEADPLAAELLERAAAAEHPLAPVLGHTAYGISCWHRGELAEAAHHLDEAAAGARSLDRSPHVNELLDIDQIRLALAFDAYIHDLIGDEPSPESRYDDVVRTTPGDPYWELLVMNFAASSALSVGDVARSERASRRGLAAEPEGVSAFWSSAQRCYLGAALCLQGEVDDGLATFREGWEVYRGAGLRTNSATWFASLAHGLARHGRPAEAEEHLVEARAELDTYRDRFAESTVHLAAAAVARARGDDPGPELRRALAVAETQGSTRLADRVRHEADAMGVALTG